MNKKHFADLINWCKLCMSSLANYGKSKMPVIQNLMWYPIMLVDNINKC